MFWLLPFLSSSLPYLLIEFSSGPSVVKEGKATWRMSRHDMWYLLLVNQKWPILAASPSHLRIPPPPPQPNTCAPCSGLSSCFPLNWCGQSWLVELILLCHTPWQVQIGPPAIQTSGKEKEYIITMKYYNTEIYRVKCKTPHSPNLNPHSPMALPSS